MAKCPPPISKNGFVAISITLGTIKKYLFSQTSFQTKVIHDARNTPRHSQQDLQGKNEQTLFAWSQNHDIADRALDLQTAKKATPA